MNLVDAYNVVNQAARSVQANGVEHDKIREALNVVGQVVKEKLDAEQDKQDKQEGSEK